MGHSPVLPEYYDEYIRCDTCFNGNNVTMKPSKKASIKKTYEILKHNKKDIKNTIWHLSDRSVNLILEIISNLVFNKKLTCKLGKKKCFINLKKNMLPKKKQWIDILTKNKSPIQKRKFISSQTGSGSTKILETIVSILPSLLMFI